MCGQMRSLVCAEVCNFLFTILVTLPGPDIVVKIADEMSKLQYSML